MLDGDISLHRLSYAMCMYFNKRIFDELGLSYPYDMVKNGTWPFDAFQKLVQKGAKDLNGDGVITPEDDQLGFYTQEWQSPISILYTGGQRIYSKDDEGIPVLTLNTSKTVDIFDKYFDLMDTDATFLHFTSRQITTAPTYSQQDVQCLPTAVSETPKVSVIWTTISVFFLFPNSQRTIIMQLS